MTTMLPPRTPVEGGPPMDEYGRITIEPGATKLTDVRLNVDSHELGAQLRTPF